MSTKRRTKDFCDENTAPIQEEVACKWVGESVSSLGAIHYRSVQLGDATYSIGDTVFVKASSNEPDYICLLSDLFENVFTGDRDMEAKVIWFLRQEEVISTLSKMKRKPQNFYDEREIFFSKNNSRIFIESITGKANVSLVKDEGAEFVCRKIFRSSDGTFAPVSQASFTSTLFSFETAATTGRSLRTRPADLCLAYDVLSTKLKTPEPSLKRPRRVTECRTAPPRSTKKQTKPDQPLYSSPKPPKKKKIAIPLKRVTSRILEMTPEQPVIKMGGKSKERVRRSLPLSVDAVTDRVFDEEDSELSLDSSSEEEFVPDDQEEEVSLEKTTPSDEEEADDLEEPLGTPSVSRKTPRRRSAKNISLSLPTRTLSSRKENRFETARSRLHVAAVPTSLPCREAEFTSICAFVEGKLMDGTGGCMYISGVPGTGKTATVLEVAAHLRQSVQDGDIPDFQFIGINGMRLTAPHQAFVEILKQLTGEKASPARAATLLENYFTTKKRRNSSIVLLADELDLLWTRKQAVLYSLFDWPTRPNAKLIVLAVANTMDLPERILMKRVASRLGLTRLTFQPYTFQQLQEIISNRLDTLNVFAPDAVQLAARKVAAVSGDARRSLEICRRATELAELERGAKIRSDRPVVTMRHIATAVQEMFSSPMIVAVKKTSANEKLFLQAILVEFRRTGLEETTLEQVYAQLQDICSLESLPEISYSEAVSLCCDLSSSHLLLIENTMMDAHRKIRLNLTQEDAHFALTEHSQDN